MKTTCHFCDSDKVEEIEIEDKFPVPYCEEATITHHIFRCKTCQGEGDFAKTQEKDLKRKIARANFLSAPGLINKLAKDGFTMTYFEKALRLPFRTTPRWKLGKISHSSLALLRLIRFCPDLLAVADDNFSEQAKAEYRFKQMLFFFGINTINTSGAYNTTEGKKELKLEGTFIIPNTQTASSIELKPKWSECTL